MKAIYNSPIGLILIESSEIGIKTSIFVDIIDNEANANEMTSHQKFQKKHPQYLTRYEEVAKHESMTGDGKIDEMTSQCINQLDEYFGGKRKKFNLPLDLIGTPFQLEVWNELQKIPFGSTISYRQLSLWLGNVKAFRAVGSANAANPVSIIVPCHRVIGSDGSLTGYASGLWRKKWLLEHENSKQILNLMSQNKKTQLNLFDQ